MSFPRPQVLPHHPPDTSAAHGAVRADLSLCHCPEDIRQGWDIDTFGGFHGHGGPPTAGGLIRENPTKMDVLGVSLFQETTIYGL